MTTRAPGTGKFEFDNGLVNERFADGSVSFDIFDAMSWAGTEEDGMYYARLIAAAPETAAERDKLKAINAELVDSARALLYKIDNINSEEFSHGGDRQEREQLRATLAKHETGT